MTTYRFVLPLPPNRANDRSSWRKVHRERAAYLEALYAIQKTGLSLQYTTRSHTVFRRDFEIPDPPAEPHSHVSVTATLYVYNRMDQDNALARLKWPVDWIVEAGYVADDSPEHWSWAGVPEQRIDRKRQRVEIRLEANRMTEPTKETCLCRPYSPPQRRPVEVDCRCPWHGYMSDNWREKLGERLGHLLELWEGDEAHTMALPEMVHRGLCHLDTELKRLRFTARNSESG